MNQRGVTLIEVMVGLAIIVLALGVYNGLADYSERIMANQQLKWTGQRMTTSFMKMAGLPSTIRSSLVNHPENNEVAACIFSTSPCLNLAPSKSIRLYLPFIEPVGPYEFISVGAITGTREAPMRYNALGEVCDTLVKTCPEADWPIEVFTEYNFTCPPLFDKVYDDSLRGGKKYFGAIYPDGLVVQPECPKPDQIRIYLTVQSTPVPGVTSNQVIRTRKESMSISYDEIMARSP